MAVPTRDRRERTLRCLDALLALDYPRYDVLVLDNASRDGTAEACRARAEGAPVNVRIEVMEGSVARVRNRAAELATGEIVAYTDSDCAPAPRWLAEGAAAFVDPEVGVVQGRTLPEPGVQRFPWDKTIEITGYTGLFESCNLFFRREAFRETPGFDEGLGKVCEDTAAGWAMLARGWRAAFAPGALVYHDVTRAGLVSWLRAGLDYGNVASVVRDYPQVRRELLWCRYFMRPRNARTVGLVLGLGLAPVDRRALILTLPYAWVRRPRRLALGELGHGVIGPLAFDLSILAGMIRGSLKYRRLVL